MPKTINRRGMKMDTWGGMIKTGKAVYIGRPSKWGNPFPLAEGASEAERDACVEAHAEWLCGEGETQRKLLCEIDELEGKDLICWCAPKRCHGDILLTLARMAPEMREEWVRVRREKEKGNG